MIGYWFSLSTIFCVSISQNLHADEALSSPGYISERYESMGEMWYFHAKFTLAFVYDLPLQQEEYNINERRINNEEAQSLSIELSNAIQGLNTPEQNTILKNAIHQHILVNRHNKRGRPREFDALQEFFNPNGFKSVKFPDKKTKRKSIGLNERKTKNQVSALNSENIQLKNIVNDPAVRDELNKQNGSINNKGYFSNTAVVLIVFSFILIIFFNNLIYLRRKKKELRKRTFMARIKPESSDQLHILREIRRMLDTKINKEISAPAPSTIKEQLDSALEDFFDGRTLTGKTSPSVEQIEGTSVISHKHNMIVDHVPGIFENALNSLLEKQKAIIQMELKDLKGQHEAQNEIVDMLHELVLGLHGTNEVNRGLAEKIGRERDFWEKKTKDMDKVMVMIQELNGVIRANNFSNDIVSKYLKYSRLNISEIEALPVLVLDADTQTSGIHYINLGSYKHGKSESWAMYFFLPATSKLDPDFSSSYFERGQNPHLIRPALLLGQFNETKLAETGTVTVLNATVVLKGIVPQHRFPV